MTEAIEAQLNRLERKLDEAMDLFRGKRSGPTIKKGKSSQVVSTPMWFVDALEDRFGEIVFDLAASESNKKRDRYFDEKQNSLVQDWTAALDGGVGFLNSPFSPAVAWATKCSYEAERGAKLLYLCQASMDTVWFAENIMGKARVYTLRIAFDGEPDPFPKGLALCAFNLGEPAVIRLGSVTAKNVNKKPWGETPRVMELAAE